MGCFSPHSPEHGSRRQRLLQLFSEQEFEMTNPRVYQLSAHEDQGWGRLAFDLRARSRAGGEEWRQRQVHQLQFVREDGCWRLWESTSAHRDFALALLDTPKQAQRVRLMVGNADLVTPELLQCLEAHMETLFHASDWDGCLEVNVLACEIARRLGDLGGEAKALLGISDIRHRLGDELLALEEADRSEALFEQIGDERGQALAAFNRGKILSWQGRTEEAREHLERSYARSERRGHHVGMGLAADGLGTLYLRMGVYREAAAWYGRARRHYLHEANRRGLAETTVNLAGVYMAQCAYPQALEQLQAARSLFEEMQDRWALSDIDYALGVVHLYLGNGQEGAGCFARGGDTSLEIGNRSGLAKAYLGFGMVCQRAGMLREAAENYSLSVGIFEEQQVEAMVAMARSHLGQVHYQLGDFARALEEYEQARLIGSAYGNPDREMRSCALSADVYLAAARQTGAADQAASLEAEAEARYRQAVEILESLRGRTAGGVLDLQRYFEDKVQPYHQLLGLLVKQGRNDEALQIAERARGRALLDALVTGPAPLEVRLEEEEGAAPGRGTPWGSRGQVPVVDADEAATLLPGPDAAVAAFTVTQEVTYLFVLGSVVPKGGAAAPSGPPVLRVYPIPISLPDLAKRVEDLREQVTNPNVLIISSDLYPLLLGPAQEQLSGKRALIVVPDGPLWQLPFQALPLPRQAGEKRRYLIEAYNVSYAPSLTALREMRALRELRRRQPPPYQVLALGDPAVEGSELEGFTFKPLPDMANLARELERRYGGPPQARAETGPGATYEYLRREARDYRVVVLGTHGWVHPERPLQSFLLIAPNAEGGRSRLEAWELPDLGLNAELVLLAACRTAEGYFGAGEGVIGLAWALFIAGCPMTLATQWEAWSAPTRELVLTFLANWAPPSTERATAAGGTPSAAEALQQAQLALLRQREFRHPYFWAGYVLMGDGG